MAKQKQRINASTEIEMADGTTVKLTVTWGLLARLRAEDKKLYKRFSGLVMGGMKDDIAAALDIIYCGYVCAYLDERDSLDGALTQDEFTACAPPDIFDCLKTANELINPKAAQASATHSA